MGTMVKMEKLSSGHIDIRVIEKRKPFKPFKSERFIADDKKLREALDGEDRIFDKDIYSFGEFYLDSQNALLNLQFTFIRRGYDSGNPVAIQGSLVYVAVDALALAHWLETSEAGDKKSFLSFHEKRESGPKIVFSESANKVLRDILKVPVLRHKFAKAVSGFQNWRGNGATITFYDDCMKHSFYWEERRDGKRIMNGGLICHRDYKEPDNLAKAHYSTHT